MSHIFITVTNFHVVGITIQFTVNIRATTQCCTFTNLCTLCTNNTGDEWCNKKAI